LLSAAQAAAQARRTPTSTGLKRKKVKAKVEAEKTRGGRHFEPTQAAVPPPARPGAHPKPPNQPQPLRISRRPRAAKKRNWRRPAIGAALLAVIGAAALWATGRLPLPFPEVSAPNVAALIGNQTAPTSTGISTPVLPGGDLPVASEESTASPAGPILPGGATAIGGSRIAYVSGVEISSSMDLFVMSLDGSSVIQLTDDAANNRSPVFSPDGTRIAFRAERQGRRVIFVVVADGSSAPVALTDPSSDNYAPAWSPDGSHIAFVSERDGNPEIYVMNADGSSSVRLTDSWANDYSPTWSPDGSRLAYFFQP
jgi:hypothetical protein